MCSCNTHMTSAIIAALSTGSRESVNASLASTSPLSSGACNMSCTILHTVRRLYGSFQLNYLWSKLYDLHLCLQVTWGPWFFIKFMLIIRWYLSEFMICSYLPHRSQPVLFFECLSPPREIWISKSLIYWCKSPKPGAVVHKSFGDN